MKGVTRTRGGRVAVEEAEMEVEEEEEGEMQDQAAARVLLPI